MRQTQSTFPPLTIVVFAAFTACGGNGNEVTQVPPGQTATPPAHLSVTPPTASLNAGTTVRFSVNVQPANASASVTWSISGAGCSHSACGSIDASGMFTAPDSVPNPATFELVATSTLDATKSDSAVITINPAPPPPSGSFSLISNMVAARGEHSATSLLDGRVLIAGGDGAPSSPAGRTAEIYDPATRRFSPTGSMNKLRAMHSAVLLPNGRVFIVGPSVSLGAELYDPATGVFQQISGTMLPQEDVGSAALLANGKVLVAGSTGAQLYDPNTSTFQQVGKYADGSVASAAAVVALSDGRALVLGRNPPQLYDPTTNSFSPTGSLSSTGVYGKELYSATPLNNGMVLVAGGMDDFGRTNEAALYDPVTGSFTTSASMSFARDAHAAVRLVDGRVLVVGGDGWACSGNFCQFSGSVAAAELYDPVNQTFTRAGNTNIARTVPGVAVLKNGDVLITGGWLYCGIGCFQGSTATAEIYHFK